MRLHWQHEARMRARQYAESRSITLINELGAGFDGIVFQSSRRTAAKVLGFEPLYVRERDVYLRLFENEIDEIEGFAVPRMIEHDPENWVVEMEIVSPPFVLDFAGAYLDQPPEYPVEIMEEWQAEKREQFGDQRWDVVRSIMASFARFGIHLADVKPGNITFASNLED